jgi:SAM-dependent methyltransferase
MNSTRYREQAVACPACAATTVHRHFRSFTAREAAQHFVLAQEYPQQHEELVKAIRRLWQAEQCDMLECAQCGLGFAHPFVGGDAEFYNLAYPYSDYPKDKWEFRRTLVELRKQSTEARQVLEIGAGFGYFLEQISPSLFRPEDVTAIEYNDTARARLVSAGYNALGVDVRSSALASVVGRMDCVFMFQVLEHLSGLDELMARLNQLMRPAASLFIAVPNQKHVNFNEVHGSLCDMPPNHISRWTPKSIKAFANRHGFELQSCELEPSNWRDFVRQDLVFSHMRRAQTPGTLSNRVRGAERGPWRKRAEGLVALSALPARLPVWLSAAQDPAVRPNSLWARLRRL